MSGDIVLLQGGVDGHVEALIRAAGIVATHAGVRTAVIGGLAVTCRLATAHRATGDIDVVADESAVVAAGRSAADNLVAACVAQRDEGGAVLRVYVNDTKVEIIETATIDWADVADVEPELARLFVLAHRWALESATVCKIGVTGSTLEIQVPVAIPASTIAMKLHAIQDRKDDRKRASDGWDIYRLINSHGQFDAFVSDLAAAPHGLVPLMSTAVERYFRDEVTRTRRWIQTYGDPAWAAQATEQALLDVAADFAAALP